MKKWPESIDFMHAMYVDSITVERVSAYHVCGFGQSGEGDMQRWTSGVADHCMYSLASSHCI